MRIGKLPNRGIVDKLLVIVQGLATVADGLIMVGSLGFYGSMMSLDISRYRAWRMIQRGRKNAMENR